MKIMSLNRRDLVRSMAIGGASASFLGHTASGQTPAASPAAGRTRTVEHPLGVTEVPVDPQRIVSLGEEFLLADLYALDLHPVMSASNYASDYIGIDPALTEGLTPFTLYDMDVESILAAQPDLIIVPAMVFGYVEGLYEQLSFIAPTVAVPDLATDWQAQFMAIAAIFDKEADAQAIIDGLVVEIDDARESLALDGATATVATVYPGAAGVTLWLTESQAVTDVLVDLGVTLVPDAADYMTDHNGRAEISLEDVQVMTGDRIFLLQTDAAIAPDEQKTLDEAMANPLWQTIPAVQTGAVSILARVGYPGTVAGRRKALIDLVAIYNAA